MGRKHRGGAARGRRQPGLTGSVRIEGNKAFVETAEGSYRLTERGLRGAMNGDLVSASLVRGPHGQRRAVVEDVLEHAVKAIVGRYGQLGPLGSVRALDVRVKQDFFVVPADDSPARLGVRPGDIVAARIVRYPTREESGVVTIERRVGDDAAPDLGIQCIMARYDLADGYADRALAEAGALGLDVDAALSDPLRRDIRGRFCLTIDPVDARDFDDAISIERAEGDGWRLGVHIADVSHYVAWDTSLDLEARRRSTSVYLADRVLPMLPEILSNDLCSLKPDEDRLAMTVDIDFDARGRIRSYEAYPSVIRSRVRLDYAAAAMILAGEVDEAAEEERDLESTGGEAVGRAGDPGAVCNPKPAAAPVSASASEPTATDPDASGRAASSAGLDAPSGPDAPSDPSVLSAPRAPASSVPTIDAPGRAAAAIRAARAHGVDLAAFLRDADALARARLSIRRARGAIDFETVEVHALLDADGLPERIVTRRRTPATSLIEEAMLAANECVAEYLADRGIPASFRVHEPPSPDNLAGAARILTEIGALSPDLAAAVELGDPHAIERAVEAAHGTPYEALANALLLRSMQRAVYKPRNEGHYALGATAYCHFTSPIRRYPDLIVHRQLKLALAAERLGRRAARSRRRALAGTGPQALEEILPQLCRHASERERIADAAAHASQKVKVAQYYGARIGERASGTVSWIDEMGVFVRLDDTGAEGLLRMKGLGDEWWDLDERALRLVGSSTCRVIELGHRMVVEVRAVDVLRGHLDLALVHGGHALH